SLVPPALERAPADALVPALGELDALLAGRLDQARALGGCLRFVGSFDGEGAQASLQVLPPGHPLAAGAGTDNRVAIRSDRYRGPAGRRAAHGRLRRGMRLSTR